MMTQVRYYVGDMVQGEPTRYTPDTCPGRPCGSGCDHVSPGPRPVSDEEWAGVALTLAELSDGWTEYPALGMWRHTPEPSRVYEVLLGGLPPARATVQRVAREMAQAAHQQAVLWTMQEIDGGLEL